VEKGLGDRMESIARFASSGQVWGWALVTNFCDNLDAAEIDCLGEPNEKQAGFETDRKK
jgi:hypothetical protein